MLAKATAGESDSNFLYTTASEFVEIYVGVGAKRIRDLFTQARKNSPCIIFIDEIDGIGIQRRNKFDNEQASDQERNTTLNQVDKSRPSLPCRSCPPPDLDFLS